MNEETIKPKNVGKQYKRQYDWLKPYQWKKGESGNLAGGKKGKSLKTYVREYFNSLPDKDKIEFLKYIDPQLAWRMAEGNPPLDVNLGNVGEIPFTIIIKKDERGEDNQTIPKAV